MGVYLITIDFTRKKINKNNTFPDTHIGFFIKSFKSIKIINKYTSFKGKRIKKNGLRSVINKFKNKFKNLLDL